MTRLFVALATLFLCACATPTPEGTPIHEAASATTTADPAATLDAYYAAAADADFDRWIALFTDDARFYGTDATEDWSRDDVARGVSESFATGKGWAFDLRDRRVTLAAGGQTAWFAEIAHFANTDYTLRPSGVLVLTDDGWKIAQLVMGVPFPNAIYDPMRMALQVAETGAAAETDAINAALDALHVRASGGDVDVYFSAYTEDAMFFGTDETERWTMEAFRAYAAPAFEDGEGWTYTPLQREIVLAPMGNVAWFDEVLAHARYPNTRGTGVLVRTDDGWKIAQYSLTFLIPNAEVTALSAMLDGAE